MVAERACKCKESHLCVLALVLRLSHCYARLLSRPGDIAERLAETARFTDTADSPPYSPHPTTREPLAEPPPRTAATQPDSAPAATAVPGVDPAWAQHPDWAHPDPDWVKERSGGYGVRGAMASQITASVRPPYGGSPSPWQHRKSRPSLSPRTQPPSATFDRLTSACRSRACRCQSINFRGRPPGAFRRA